MAKIANRLINEWAAEIEARVLATAKRTVPHLRRVRQWATRRAQVLEAADVVRLALRLLATTLVPRWWVYELVHHHPPALAYLNEPHLRALGDGVAAWDEVDAFACYLTGPAWREGQIPDTLIHEWATASDRWWQRVALVSTVPLNSTARGGSGDAARTLAVCELVKHEADHTVVKALSWALRALAVKEPDAVRAFVQANAACLAASVKREVGNKLATGLKNPRSRARAPRKS